MSDEYRRFCVRCGADLPENATYCPKCGSPSDGQCDGRYTGTPCCSTRCGGGCSGLESASILITLYAAGVLMFSLMYVVTAVMMNEEMWQMLIDSTGSVGGIGLTMEQFKSTALISGSFGIISGIAALVSRHCIKTRTNGKLAVIACLVATVTSIVMFVEMGIFTALFGAYMTYRIHKNKCCFDS